MTNQVLCNCGFTPEHPPCKYWVPTPIGIGDEVKHVSKGHFKTLAFKKKCLRSTLLTIRCELRALWIIAVEIAEMVTEGRG